LQIKTSEHPVSLDHQYSKDNPITRTSKLYVLYDEFHKVNSKKETEQLRHINYVPEMKNINTEVSEQLNSVIGRNQYFLNRMDLPRHYFFLRLIIHLLNEDRNDRNKRNLLKNNKKCTIKTDWFGRLHFTMNSANIMKPLQSSDESCDISCDDSFSSEDNLAGKFILK